MWVNGQFTGWVHVQGHYKCQNAMYFGRFLVRIVENWTNEFYFGILINLLKFILYKITILTFIFMQNFKANKYYAQNVKFQKH